MELSVSRKLHSISHTINVTVTYLYKSSIYITRQINASLRHGSISDGKFGCLDVVSSQGKR